MPAIVAKSPVNEDRSTAGKLHRLSLDQYHSMIEKGVLTENDSVELIEGLLVAKMTHLPIHDGIVSVLARELRALLPAKWALRVQSAVTLDDSEPEPDIAVVLAPEERYFAEHPGPRDIGIVVEVADSSLAYDRTDKLRIYARNKITSYWIVNVADRSIEEHRDPRAGRKPGYATRHVYPFDATIDVVVGAKKCGALEVRKLFP
jgi:Uma2 family endonuclease